MSESFGASSRDPLGKNLFLVKEHVGMFKAANNYDIYDPESGALVMECREEKLGWLTKLLRFTDWKRYTPFDIEVRTPDRRRVVRVRRGVAILRSTVEVLDETDRVIGRFRQKLISLGGAFRVLDPRDREMFYLKGKWTGWDFRFLSGERELAHVTKKWSGMGKEMFTSADTYMLEIAAEVATEDETRKLIMGAVMCIDMVLKE